ncbi:hypothetical protein HanXRQr2_Chr13g0574741 [Helianthus annuus]|uniref:FH2 domain-containing protein n=1 Tax=Helianthus annuus TaxID=4232 RepID=A0A9K3EFM5_HELAN|nr:hypothetical protein HanXRQr2_Chr13g0574741 [Helianthus annuus]
MELALDKIMSIRQEGTVRDYCDSFLLLFDQVRNSEEMSDFYAIYLFICGLEPRIRNIFVEWHQYSYLKVEDVISLALKIDTNNLHDSFSPFDPKSSFYIEGLEFDIKITLDELMMDNEFFRNGKIQEVGIVQETIVDEVFVEMREENSEVELVSPGEFRSEVDNKNIIYQRKEPENQLVLNSGSVSVVIFDDENADVGWESEQLNQTKGVNESTYVCIVDEEKMSRIKKHLHWTDTGWVYNRECSGGVIVQFKACFKYVDENMVWEVGDNVEVKGVDEEIVTGMLQKWHEWKSRWVWPKIGSKSCLKRKRRMRSYIGDKELSGKCEQFFLELMMVPPESKLQAFLFQIQFNTQLSLFKKSLKTVNMACDEVWNYVKFKEIKKFFLYLVGTLDRDDISVVILYISGTSGILCSFGTIGTYFCFKMTVKKFYHCFLTLNDRVISLLLQLLSVLVLQLWIREAIKMIFFMQQCQMLLKLEQNIGEDMTDYLDNSYCITFGGYCCGLHCWNKAHAFVFDTCPHRLLASHRGVRKPRLSVGFRYIRSLKATRGTNNVHASESQPKKSEPVPLARSQFHNQAKQIPHDAMTPAIACQNETTNKGIVNT